MSGDTPGEPLPPCDCLDSCGDDERVHKGQVAKCPRMLERETFHARLLAMGDMLRARRKADGCPPGLPTSCLWPLLTALEASTDREDLWRRLLGDVLALAHHDLGPELAQHVAVECAVVAMANAGAAEPAAPRQPRRFRPGGVH